MRIHSYYIKSNQREIPVYRDDKNCVNILIPIKPRETCTGCQLSSVTLLNLHNFQNTEAIKLIISISTYRLLMMN